MQTQFLLPDKHACLVSATDVQTLLEPFIPQLRTIFFGWTRMYNDGSRANLTNNPEWVKHYYQQGHYNYSKCERHPSCYQEGFAIWDLWDKNSKAYQIATKDAEDRFDIAHGVSIIKTHAEGCDIFDFAARKAEYTINTYYINHIHLFEQYIQHFYDKAKFLIKRAVCDRFTLNFDDDIDIYTEEPDLVIIPFANNNKSLLDLSQLRNISNPLTMREKECLEWLVKGKTAHEMALILGISKRTSEKHIEKIKEKLGCYTLFQLGLKIGSIDRSF